jgi:hypothetical protein
MPIPKFIKNMYYAFFDAYLRVPASNIVFFLWWLYLPLAPYKRSGHLLVYVFFEIHEHHIAGHEFIIGIFSCFYTYVYMLFMFCIYHPIKSVIVAFFGYLINYYILIKNPRPFVPVWMKISENQIEKCVYSNFYYIPYFIIIKWNSYYFRKYEYLKNGKYYQFIHNRRSRYNYNIYKD